ncbi:hypothetical protein ACFWPK_22345 [Nocardia sp. NPDC058519]|uniref:hypothetical protein n=1 Tax=Nocardia sp. NPDC058519 TaxID=3346535 RepID=UPI0036698FB8
MGGRGAASHSAAAAAWSRERTLNESITDSFYELLYRGKIAHPWDDGKYHKGDNTVKLDDLRAAVGSRVSRAEFDAAIADLSNHDGVHVRQEVDRKILTDRQKRDGVVLGGTMRHHLTIETRVHGKKLKRDPWA